MTAAKEAVHMITHHCKCVETQAKRETYWREWIDCGSVAVDVT